jgi:murein DD-endopeptidase MepM/ murein hydrolase activator NlpD
MYAHATAVAVWLVQAALTGAAPRVTLSTKEAKPGDPVLVTVASGDKAKAPDGKAGKTTLVFFPRSDGWQAVFAVPHEDPPDTIEVAVDGTKQTVTVVPHEFPEETAHVPPEMAEPPPEKRPQIEEDNAAIVKAMKDRSTPWFEGRFKRPKGKTTSPFGSWRTLTGGYRSRHLGMDVAAKLGAPVRAIQGGRVTLVRDGFLTGGTVIVQHGGGIASAYFHLDRIAVAEGQELRPGALLGRVSLTGRTTGPHIHLGIWVPGGWVDPAAFFRLRF